MRAELSTLGAGIKSLWVPDRNCDLTNIVPGYDNPADYVRDTNFIAGVIGDTPTALLAAGA
jgi:galactose mutarotase-like enzyme